jgi:phenylacetic acid degradation operon negative regulatory protein
MHGSGEQADHSDDLPDAARRPQSLMLTTLALHVFGRPIAASSASFIQALARVRVSEHAVRSTLARMTRRGLLERHQRGRQMYFGLSARSHSALADGWDRIRKTGAINREWDGNWTIIAFSLPDSRRATRHDLRSRLTWGGFSSLQAGLWISPIAVDVTKLLGGLDLEENFQSFTAQTIAPTQAAKIISSAFDIAAIGTRYRSFLARWDVDDPLPAVPDMLAKQLLLNTDWLDVVRRDPHLPVQHLPNTWPAIRGQDVFRRLAQRYEKPASEALATFFDTIDLPDTRPGSGPAPRRQEN